MWFVWISFTPDSIAGTARTSWERHLNLVPCWVKPISIKVFSLCWVYFQSFTTVLKLFDFNSAAPFLGWPRTRFLTAVENLSLSWQAQSRSPQEFRQKAQISQEKYRKGLDFFKVSVIIISLSIQGNKCIAEKRWTQLWRSRLVGRGRMIGNHVGS